MNLFWRLWNNNLLYLASILFYIGDTKFFLPLEDSMTNS